MRKLFKERKLFEGGNYMRKYGIEYFTFEEKTKIILLKSVSLFTKTAAKRLQAWTFSCNLIIHHTTLLTAS